MPTPSDRHLIVTLACWMLLSAGAAPAAAYTYHENGGNCPDGVRWAEADLPVSYHINEEGASGLTYDEVRRAVERGFDAWEEVCCASFTADYRGATAQTVSPGGDDNGSSQHVLDWKQDWPQHLGRAAATTLYVYDDCEFLHTDIMFNDAHVNWNTSGTLSGVSLDVRAIATHEIGHVVGLRHTGTYEATMFPQLHDVSQQHLHDDDREGVCFLYPSGRQCDGVGGGCEAGEGTRPCELQEGVCEGAEIACESDGEARCGADEYGTAYEPEESSCDGRDNDCDGEIDEGVVETYFRDGDGDGFGDPDETTVACPPAPEGFVADDGDCAPADPDEPGDDGRCAGASDPADAGAKGDVDVGESIDVAGGGDGAETTDATSRPDVSEPSSDAVPVDTAADAASGATGPPANGCSCAGTAGPPPIRNAWLLAFGLALASCRWRRRR